MKKNILKLAFASAFALMAGYGVYASQQEVEMSDLAMANVEALASGEVDIPYICQGNIKACYDDYYNQFYWGIKLY